MTDQRLRAAERAAATGDLDARVALARARLRAGESVSLVLREGEDCPACNGSGLFDTGGFTPWDEPISESCLNCDATGKVRHGDHVVTWGEVPLSVAVPLRALVGCEVSRAVGGWPPEDGHHHGPVLVDSADPCLCGGKVCNYCAEAAEFVRAIARLAADLPPVRVEVSCGCFNGHDFTPVYLCGRCTGTGKRTHETPGDRYLLAAVATAAARAALPVWEASPEGGNFVWEQGRYARSAHGRAHADDVPNLAPRRAIQAAEAWLACPCPERLDECRRLLEGPNLGPVFSPLLYAVVTTSGLPGTTATCVSTAVEQAARVTDVRPAIREAVLSMTGGVW